jgi:hypothetical protein
MRNGRLLGRLLALRARLEIADRRFEAALHTLQTGFALAQSYTRNGGWGPAKGATDGDGILIALLDRVREWVQTEGSPNLYWALANLPRPMVDRRHALEVEEAGVYWTFPELRHPDQLTAEQAQGVLERIWQILGDKPDKEEARRASREAVARLLPRARLHLMERWLKRQPADVKPASTAVLVYLVDEYRRVAEDIFKWAGIPYPQAMQGLEQSMRHFARLRKSAPDNPLLHTMVSVSNQFQLFAIRDRETGLLQCVEGLRAYAAHAGRLPKSLNDVSPDTPAPPDPVLGKPFEYHSDGITATLQASSPRPTFWGSRRVYQITLKR